MKKMIRFVFYVSCFALLFTSCKPKEIFVHDIQYRDRLQIDSVNVYKRDSIRITQRGDTVFFETFKTMYRDRVKIKTDSINKFITRQVVTTVEKPLKPWQKALMYTGLFSIISIIIFFIYKLKNKYHEQRTSKTQSN